MARWCGLAGACRQRAAASRESLRFYPCRLAVDLLADPFQAIRARLHPVGSSLQLTAHGLGKVMPAAGNAARCSHLGRNGPRGVAPGTRFPAAVAAVSR